MKKIILIICFLMVPIVSRAETLTLADMLIGQGVQDLQRGQINQAVGEFSKALMLEPSNEKALSYLHQLGYSNGIYSANQMNNDIIEVQNQQKVAIYRDEINKQDQEINHSASQINQLKNQLQDTQMQMKNQEFALEHKDLEMSVVSAKRSQIFNDVEEIDEHYFWNENSEFKSEKNFDNDDYILMQEVAYAQRMYQQIAQFENEAQTKDQFMHQDKLINVMEDYLSLREEELEQAKDQYVSAQIDLTQKQLQLMDLINQLNDMNENYGNLGVIEHGTSPQASLKNEIDAIYAQTLDQNKLVNEKQKQIASLSK